MTVSSILVETLGTIIHQNTGALDLCFQGMWLSERTDIMVNVGVKSSTPQKETLILIYENAHATS